jgi:hypothetical protein
MVTVLASIVLLHVVIVSALLAALLTKRALDVEPAGADFINILHL